MPSYAQAVTSLYAEVLFGGKVLNFHVTAGSRPQIVRKHSTKPVYVIAASTERNGNIKGSCKAAANVTSASVGAPNEVPLVAAFCTASTISGCAWPIMRGPQLMT